MKLTLFIAIICCLFMNIFVNSPFGAEIESVELRGRIIDIVTQPVAGAEVYLYDSKQVKRPADFISQKTKIDGRYKLTVPVGVYWAVAIIRQTGSSFGPLQIGDKHSGDPLALDLSRKKINEMDFTVMDLRDAVRHSRKRGDDLFEIRGRILDKDEKPVAMAYVLADSRSKQSAEIPQHLSAWTDIEGKYTMYLPAGGFHIGAATLMPPSRKEELSRYIEVVEDMAGIDIILHNQPE
jgi:hypothetical protein